MHALYPVLQLLTQNEIRQKEQELEDKLRHLQKLQTVSKQSDGVVMVVLLQVN